MTIRSLIWTTILPTLIAQSIGRHPAKEAADAEYEQFLRVAGDSKSAEVIESGDRLFKALVTQRPEDATLALLSKRLDAAQRIGTLIAGVVRPSQVRVLEGISGMDDLGLVPASPKGKHVPAALPPPAEELYWTHLSTFTGEFLPAGLPAQQAVFLGRYYDLQMRDSIVKIGRQVMVADPNSSDNACYAMVLPLLYLQAKDNAWNQIESFLALFPPHQLEVLWRFSLLQADQPLIALQIARYQANTTRQEFSLPAWASATADVCVAGHRPDLAERLLHMAIDNTKDRNQIAELWLKIVESQARCGDYAAAAQTCRQIVHDLPENPLYGRIMATYFGYLAREAKADQIIAETESALTDVRCQPNLPQILYLRWWALSKTNRQDEAVRIAQRLIEEYPRNLCVAPVLLERATDALARQQYDRCRELLTQLTKDFSGTESAKRAQEILARFQGRGIQQGTDNLSRTKTSDRLKGN